MRTCPWTNNSASSPTASTHSPTAATAAAVAVAAAVVSPSTCSSAAAVKEICHTTTTTPATTDRSPRLTSPASSTLSSSSTTSSTSSSSSSSMSSSSYRFASPTTNYATPKHTPVIRPHAKPGAPPVSNTASRSSSGSSRDRPLVGLRVAQKYEIERILGKGSTANVYAGRDASTGLPVAVKAVNKHGFSAFDMDLMRLEAALHRRCAEHPHVLDIIDVVETHTHYYIVTELATTDLFDYILANAPLDDNTIKQIFAQICGAVEFGHVNNVFHRDIKPENILVRETPDGPHILLGDYGLATTDEISTEFRTGSTRYLPPEALGLGVESYRPRDTDVWGLGVLLMNLVFERNPWCEASLADPVFSEFVRDATVLQQEFWTMSSHLASCLNTVFLTRCDLDTLKKIVATTPAFRVTKLRSESLDSGYFSPSECELEDEDEDYDMLGNGARKTAPPGQISNSIPCRLIAATVASRNNNNRVSPEYESENDDLVPPPLACAPPLSITVSGVPPTPAQAPAHVAVFKNRHMPRHGSVSSLSSRCSSTMSRTNSIRKGKARGGGGATPTLMQTHMPTPASKNESKLHPPVPYATPNLHARQHPQPQLQPLVSHYRYQHHTQEEPFVVGGADFWWAI